MSEKGEVEQAWERAIKTIPVVRGRRKVKVVAADGSVREADAADVLASLIEREGLETVVREGVLPVEIQRRRAAGLPDLCATCGKALSMGRLSLKARGQVPERWSCGPCAARRTLASISPERKLEIARTALSKFSKDQVAKMRQAQAAKKSKSELSDIARKAHQRKTPEERSEIARKRCAAMTPEQRSERARKANSSRSPEQRSEAGKKARARGRTRP